jgi:CO/xanthine dehydrogenase Mo-binding subunit
LKNPALFVEDIMPQGVLFGVTIRSPVAKGRLKSIESPRMPSSYTLIKAENIPGLNQLADFPVPVLAADTLSYIGEPVALLIGPDEAKVEEYAAQCLVSAEEEQAVLSSHSVNPYMVLAGRIITAGDTDQVFRSPKTVVNGTYVTGIQEHWYPEPNGAVAVPGGDKNSGNEKGAGNKKHRNSLKIHTATQWPFHVKRSVARVLKVPPDTVIVEPSLIGIHLDGKIWYPSLISCHAALGAFITQKPVRLILTREEDFRYTPKRNGAEIHIRSALGKEGELLGTEIGIAVNLGAYGVFTDEILDQTCLGSLGAYKYSNIKIRGSALTTNIPPQGPFGGFGLSQGFFAIERHVSHIADTLHQDPAEWRKNNSLHRNGSLVIGAAIKEQVPMEQLIDTTAAMSDYYRKWASYELLRGNRRGKAGIMKEETLRGIGIATAYQGSGFLYHGADKGVYEVELTLEKDGSLEIRTSMVSAGREYFQLWRNIASEILSVDAESVRIVTDDTGVVPDSGPASLSRNITAVTKLVERSCLAIRKQRFRDPLPITVSRSSRPAKLPVWEGKLAAPAEISFDQNVFAHLSWGAAVVEVEIDPVSYIPNIRGAWLGIDGGRILSEKRARNSLKISTIQALGWASREYLVYKEGKIPEELIQNYDIPVSIKAPPIYIDFVWNDTVTPKGIGELPFNCVPAAYVQAVSQAMDHPFEKIPLSPQDIWEAEKLKKTEGEA